ncbi:MAG: hypothetical protein CMJ83_06695 [Planctomycetes bacterium]|nr:hypothetical protein [Planctomycetota bacterium]
MTRVLLLPGVLVLAAVAGLWGQTTELVVKVTSPVEAERLAASGLLVTGAPPQMHVFVSQAQHWEVLRRLDLPMTVLHEDLTAFYQSRLTQPSSRNGITPAVGQGSMGGYFTYTEIISAMDDLQQQFPNIVKTRETLGQSWENRPIYAWKISDNPTVDENEPEVLIDGGHHANEPVSVCSAVWCAQQLCEGYGVDEVMTALVDTREIYIVPIVNPDGYVFNEMTNPLGGGAWRKNRTPDPSGSFGVDPNRNYGYMWGFNNNGSSSDPTSATYRGLAPFSEPCTLVMKTFAETRNFSLGITQHAWGDLVLIPQNYGAFTPVQPLRDAYEGLTADMNRLAPRYRCDYQWRSLGYFANGTCQDWWYGGLYGGQQMWSFVIELGNGQDGFWPASSRIVPICEDGFAYQTYLLCAAGSSPRIDDIAVTEASGGTIANAWEPGETLDIVATVANIGTQSADFTVTVEATSAQVTVINGSAPLGTIAGAAAISTSNAGIPLRVDIDASAVVGQTICFDVIVTTANGAPARQTVSRVVGRPYMTSLSDDFETSNGGWTVGFAGDTVTSNADGLWTQVDPTGTSLGLLAFNPEDDHTPGGNRCWVTGDDPVNLFYGAADVDGTTTLVSPVFDVAQIQDPHITFWYWFISEDQQDWMDFWLSNDGGVTWVLLGDVRGLLNDWTLADFCVEDYLPRTDAMMLRIRVQDVGWQHAVEAAFDDFTISGAAGTLNLTPSAAPAIGTAMTLAIDASPFPSTGYFLGAAFGASSGIQTDLGLVPLDPDPLFWLTPQLPSIFSGFAGTLDTQGFGSAMIVLPNDPQLVGLPFVVSGVIGNSSLLGIAGGRRLTIQ